MRDPQLRERLLRGSQSGGIRCSTTQQTGHIRECDTGQRTEQQCEDSAQGHHDDTPHIQCQALVS